MTCGMVTWHWHFFCSLPSQKPANPKTCAPPPRYQWPPENLDLLSRDPELNLHWLLLGADSHPNNIPLEVRQSMGRWVSDFPGIWSLVSWRGRGVLQNSGTPSDRYLRINLNRKIIQNEWVCNGKSLFFNGQFGGKTHYFRKHPYQPQPVKFTWFLNHQQSTAGEPFPFPESNPFLGWPLGGMGQKPPKNAEIQGVKSFFLVLVLREDDDFCW